MLDSISAIIPVYNSASTLEELSIRLVKSLEKLSHTHEIIFIDDGSTDDSFNILKKIRFKNSNIKIISLNNNFGQQNALICGFNYAKSDYIITLDDDLQNPPEEIGKLVSKILEGYDVVYGVPLKKQHTKIKNIGSRLNNSLFNFICGKPKNIKITSFRILKKDLVHKITLNKASFVYISALILRHTKNIANIYVSHDKRKHGKSNYSFRKSLLLFLKIIIYYSKLSKFIKNKKPQYKVKHIYL